VRRARTSIFCLRPEGHRSSALWLGRAVRTTAAFDQLDWTRFDVWAALARDGVVVVDTAHRESCLAWLRREGYGIESIDFRQGIGPATLAIRDLLRWEEKFGIPAKPDSLNLNALRDGFEFDLQPGEGKALELRDADVAYLEDREWLLGLLAIATEYSLQQLALGARFFAVLFLDRGSPLIGAQYESLIVPDTYRTRPGPSDPFSAPGAVPTAAKYAFAVAGEGWIYSID
jgi:hypothetical protein